MNTPKVRARRRQTLSVGRIVHYWTERGGELLPCAAIVVEALPEGRAWLEVFRPTGHGGRDRVLAEACPWAIDEGVEQIATEGKWSWPAIL